MRRGWESGDTPASGLLAPEAFLKPAVVVKADKVVMNTTMNTTRAKVQVRWLWRRLDWHPEIHAFTLPGYLEWTEWQDPDEYPLEVPLGAEYVQWRQVPSG